MTTVRNASGEPFESVATGVVEPDETVEVTDQQASYLQRVHGFEAAEAAEVIEE